MSRIKKICAFSRLDQPDSRVMAVAAASKVRVMAVAAASKVRVMAVAAASKVVLQDFIKFILFYG
jgi:hypothetical protein